MKKIKPMRWAMASMLYGAITMFFIAGCAKTASHDTLTTADTAHSQHGAQLWAEECSRCHNVRSPNMYSDAQWEVISLHMRVRANLTPVEYREILAFLKSAH